MKHQGQKLLGSYHMPEEMFGLVKVGILENIDGQMTTNQFLHKSPQKRDTGLLALLQILLTQTSLLQVVPRAEALHPGRVGCMSIREGVGRL